MSAINEVIKDTAQDWVKLKAELDVIKGKFEALDAMLKDMMYESGVTTVTLDEVTIELSTPARRSFDAQVLKDLVSASVFNKVTKPTVDTQLMDAAIKMGTIKPEVVDQVTKKTEYKQIRVK